MSGKWTAFFRDNYASQLLVGRLTATALAFITSPVVARSIGPDGRGETAAAISLFFLVPILLGVGLPTEVRRRAARSVGESALRTARALTLALFPVAIGLGVLAYFTLFSGFEAGARIVSAVGISVSPLMVSWTCDQSLLIARGRYRAVMLLQITQPATYFLVVVGLWITSHIDTATVLAANVAGTIAAAFVGIVLARVAAFGPLSPVGETLRGSIRYAGSAIAESASSRLDQVLMLPLAGAFQAGIYSAAATLAALPLALGHALAAPYFRKIARSDDQEEVRSHREEAVRVSVALGIMTAVPLFLGMWIGIPLLFGPEFVSAVPVGWALIPGSCAMIAAFVCSQALAAQGMGIRMTLVQTLALALSTVLLLLLAPAWGALGAAVGIVAGVCGPAVLATASAERRTQRGATQR